jgi:hypothetical protein
MAHRERRGGGEKDNSFAISITFRIYTYFFFAYQELLHGHQTASDLSTLTTKVLKLNLYILLEDLLKKNILGKVISHSWVIEFQERGLPHARIAFALQDVDKLREPRDFDRNVSAQLPDPVTCPSGISDRCNLDNTRPMRRPRPKLTYMVSGRYSCHYPRELADSTSVDENGYVQYRRRADSSFVRNNVCINNC